MSLATRDVLQFLAGDRLPVFRATSRHLSVAYPLQAESGIIDPRTRSKVLGLPAGYSGRDKSGGIFYWDPVQFYQAGIVQSTNVMILGKIGNRKSAQVKMEILRGVVAGYNHLATDLKNEYTLVANAIPGSKILRFGIDTGMFINALDGVMDHNTQVDLVAAMALTAMGNGRGNKTELDIIELSLLDQAIVAAHAHPKGRVAILPDAVEWLFEPSEEMALAMHRPVEFLREQGYKMALALRRLTEGDLRGMFHKETTPGLFDPTPLLVLNCEALKGEAAVIMVILINFFTQSQQRRKDKAARFHKVYHDEAWDLAIYPAFIDSVRKAFKVGGTWGVSNTIVAHHLSNLYRSGAGEAVKDLTADSGTKVLYQQDRAELEASAEELGLTRNEVNRIVDLPPGTAIYKIGNLPGIEVEQVAWPEELPLLETRHLLRGKEEPETDPRQVLNTP